MNRRSLLQSTVPAALLSGLTEAQVPARRTALYRFDYFYLRQGDQGNRLDQFLSSQMALIAKYSQCVGVFTMTVGRYTPSTFAITGFSGFEQMETADERLRRDEAYQAAFAEMEKGAEPPFDSAERVLLRATDFSPEIVPLKEKPKTPRVFEVRLYHSPTERQLKFLHERFSGHETGIFHRCGIHPILYADTIAGPKMPNMTYVIPFASLADREKAWDAFAADPEWVKVRADSVTRGGQIVAHNEISLFRPAPFSPIQ
jgi:hypothetical protein